MCTCEEYCVHAYIFTRLLVSPSSKFMCFRSVSPHSLLMQYCSDDALVEEYRIQVLSGYQESPSPVKECKAAGDYQQLIADEKLERTGVCFLRKCVCCMYKIVMQLGYAILVCVEWFTGATSEERK